MMQERRTVALVGRPNVGKSRLFNRLARKRLAIVHDQAGVTRDVNSHLVDEHYLLLDTGGIGLVVDMDHQQLVSAAEEQVWFAVQAADLICFVVDCREGLTTLDEVIAEKLRASGKAIQLVVNKVDNEGMVEQQAAFLPLGFGEGIGVSAEHGFNSWELEEAILDFVGPAPEMVGESQRVKLAFVGRPNVGKSSLCNSLLDDERLVVSEVPGTTRDSVVLDLDYKGKDEREMHFRLVDTAGLRRRKRVSHSIEYFSTLRTREAIENADIVFLVIDSEAGVTRQDKALAGEILDAGKCVILLVNKWDLAIDRFRSGAVEGFEKIEDFRREYARAALEEIFFLPKSPVLFVSALRNFSIEKILRQARQVWETSGRELSTPKVNRLIMEMFKKREPRFQDNKRFKVYYGVQVGTRPFTFRLFCNRATKLEDGYRRYLQNGFIDHFDLAGCPVRFELRGKTVRYAKKEGGRK